MTPLITLKIAFLLFVLISVQGCMFEKKFENNKEPLSVSQTPDDPLFTEEDIEKLRVEHLENLDFIDKRISNAGLRSLRRTKLKPNGVEIRIWDDGGSNPPLEGMILKKNNIEWVVKELRPTNSKQQWVLRRIPTSQVDWESVYSQLIENDIFTNISDTEVSVVEPFNDSKSVIIETLYEGKYRFYYFHAPCISKTDEAKKIVNILKILEDEFMFRVHPCNYGL